MDIKKTEVITFIAFDGKEFSHEKECLEYEKQKRQESFMESEFDRIFKRSYCIDDNMQQYIMGWCDCTEYVFTAEPGWKEVIKANTSPFNDDITILADVVRDGQKYLVLVQWDEYEVCVIDPVYLKKQIVDEINAWEY